uniref:Small ribosomal subunit protein bS16m n=1 Tax=Junco hyemalis TaxID=40217 RepID=A0A8C5JHL4_JUNHY
MTSSPMDSNSRQPPRGFLPLTSSVRARAGRAAAMVQLGSRLLRGRGGHVIIRFALGGCTNRPFFRIVAANSRRARDGKYLEQLGCLDPLPNAHGEKVAGLNLERLRYWLGCGAQLSRPAEKLLGLAGVLPLLPPELCKLDNVHNSHWRIIPVQQILLQVPSDSCFHKLGNRFYSATLISTMSLRVYRTPESFTFCPTCNAQWINY